MKRLSFALPVAAALCVLAAMLAGLVSISLHYPAAGSQTDQRRPAFAWGGAFSRYVFYLDDNPGFKSPLVREVEGNSYVPEEDLGFGTYYWKVESWPFSSITGSFDVVSSVIVSREGGEIRNEGNTPLLVSPSITGAFVLGMNGSAKIGEEENVIAEQA